MAVTKIKSDFTRVVEHATEFYLSRMGMIILFSIPCFFAFLIPLLLPSPTYMSLGGVFIRGGSIPSITSTDWAITAIAYLVSIFIIADSMVNVSLIVKSKRTLTNISTEVLGAMGKYAIKVWMATIIMSLALAALFLAFYEHPYQSILYPIVSLVLMTLFFFFVPAIVIDGHETLNAFRASFSVVMAKPLFVIMWLAIALALFLIFGMIAYALPTFLTQYTLLLFNSVIILPFLLVLSTQMYMEKYPLSK